MLNRVTCRWKIYSHFLGLVPLRPYQCVILNSILNINFHVSVQTISIYLTFCSVKEVEAVGSFSAVLQQP